MKTMRGFGTMTLVILALMAMLGGRDAKAGFAYISDQSQGFGTLDLTTGAFTLISTAGPQYYRGLQFVNGQLYGEGSDSHLYQIDKTTGAAIDLGGITGANGNITNLVASSQQGLSYFESTGNGVYSISPPSTTASSTVIGGLSGFGAAVASNGLIYESDFIPGVGFHLDTFNPLTGAGSFVASLSQVYGDFFFDGSTLYAFRNGLYTIDTTTGAENEISSLNDIFTAAAVELTASVPEPSSPVLCGLSMTAIGLAHSRKRLRRR
jgi:hypothetical protein